ncbi:hypothetical protein B7494_g794 [Chlorociboria aeruginascens]|nr:hypothetical protein B7494_g794 [Chlorociboria aeruginascens]
MVQSRSPTPPRDVEFQLRVVVVENGRSDVVEIQAMETLVRTVSSTEAPMKNDSGEFGYDTVASRQASCRMIPQVGYPYTPQLTPISPDGLTSYRTNSVSYSYPMKNCYQVPYDYSDENLNYGLQSQGYPMISPDHLGIHSSYEGPSTTRGWTPASQISKDAPLFLEQGSVYNQGPIPYHTGGYGLRHAISPDSKSYNLNNIPSLSGPTPISGNDRLLPIPATNRTAQIGSFHRSGDSALPSSHQGISSYNGLMGVPNMLTVKSSNSNSLAENNSLSTSYVPLSSNSPESIPSSQPNYGSQSVPVSQEHEIYPSSSSSLYHHDNISSEEPTYGYIHNPAPKRHSEASAASDGSLPSSTNNNLANGYPYTPLPGPPHGSHYSTTASPMDMRPLHRSSVGSIQAA